MKKICLFICVYLFFQNTFASHFNHRLKIDRAKGHAIFNNDAQVVIIHSIAKYPANLLFGETHFISTVIRNAGVLSLSNIVVNLTVNGINNFTNSKTILSLMPGDSILVSFNGYTINAVGTNAITVSVPADDDNTNNTAHFTQQVTPGTFSYADDLPATGSFGFGAGTGLILVKYPVGGGGNKVTGMKVYISNDPANIGQTVYAVAIVNGFGGGQFGWKSSNVVLTATDLGKYMYFPVTTIPATTTNGFLVGLAQTSGTTPYYPVGYQEESPGHSFAYYTAILPINNNVPPLNQTTTDGRFMIQAIMNNAVIPVLLTNFTAQKKGIVNEIAWSTSQEINSKEFVIERSKDGIVFTAIGTVAANGNSNTVSNYYFTDMQPQKGINYYRLRAVDIDAAFKLSEIRSVRNVADAELGIYPNPVKDIMNVIVDAETAGKGEIAIMDIAGKKITVLSVSLNIGSNTIIINTGKLLAGIYILKLQLSNAILVKQFTKT